MKRVLLTLLIALPIGVLLLPVKAHEVVRTGEIGGSLHIDPSDDPIAGVASPTFIEIVDSSGRFDGEECDCQLMIKLDGEVISVTNLFDSHDIHPTSTRLDIFFPKIGDYELTASGKPKEDGDFQPFTFTYQIAVKHQQLTDKMITSAPTVVSSPIALPILPFIGLIVICFAFIGGAGFYLQRKNIHS